MKQKILEPIKERPEYYDAIEAEILKLLKREIYLPLVKEIGAPKNVLKNSVEDLFQAIRAGRISYYRGQFKGRFSAEISKELKRMGAQWDRKQGSWKIPQTSLPPELLQAIKASSFHMTQKLAAIDRKIASLVPEQIAEQLQLSKLFDTTIWKVDRDFKKTIQGLVVAPELTPERRKFLADEWSNNMKLSIENFTKKEIQKLRQQVQTNTFQGNRYESMIKTIQKSYNVSQNKAKFLARQETGLLMAKFKASRYMDAGVDDYIWGCVAGSANHPVRPLHKALEGKKWKFSDPPVTDEQGHRNNPGEDYNCRCFAKPIVKFK